LRRRNNAQFGAVEARAIKKFLKLRLLVSNDETRSKYAGAALVS
jgi:hypothetical protein